MTGRRLAGAGRAVFFVALAVFFALMPHMGRAAPFAALVMDARSGEVLYADNADSRLHPASLTKMMTLYIAFEAIRLGEITLDTQVTVSKRAASEPPSKLGLRAGQKIQLRYLIRAAAVKSANDAATAIGEAIGGSEAAFARRMNRTAAALGMTRSTFKNAHGLTESGHLSSARDMAMLGRHLFFDYPQYYNIFSRRSADAGGRQVNNTNRRFLDAYRGADGIKTGYTRAAGFNLVASAERGGERIIASVFGGTSTANRNARMAELLDMGFKRAPSRVAVNRPAMPRYDGPPPKEEPETIVVAEGGPMMSIAGKVIRMSGSPVRSLRPRPRGAGPAEPPADLLAAISTDAAAAIAGVEEDEAVASAAEAAAAAAAVAAAEIAAAEAAAATEDAQGETTEVAEADTAPGDQPVAEAGTEASEPAVALLALARVAPPSRPRGAEAPADAAEEEAPAPADAAIATLLASAPPARPEPQAGAGAESSDVLLAEVGPDGADELAGAEDPLAGGLGSLFAPAGDPAATGTTPDFTPPAGAVALAALEPAPDEAVPGPQPGLETLQLAAAALVVPSEPDPVIRPEPIAPEVVSRLSTSGGRHWGVSLGRYGSRTEAEKALIAMSLSEMSGLNGALRKIVQRSGGYEANFMGMSEEQAGLACRRIEARGRACSTIGG